MTRRDFLRTLCYAPAIAVAAAAYESVDTYDPLLDIEISKYGKPIPYLFCKCGIPDDEPHFHTIESVRWIETNRP